MLLGVGPIASYPLSSGGAGSIQFVEATLTSSGAIYGDLEHYAGFVANSVSSGVMGGAPVCAVPLCSNFAGIQNTSASLNNFSSLTTSPKLIAVADGTLPANGSVVAATIIARRIDAVLVATGSISADALHRTPWTSDFFAYGTVNASIQIRSPMNATCSGVGSIAPSPVILRKVANTTLNGAGTVTANAIVFKKAVCLMTASGTFNMSLGTNAEARLVGKSTIFANATKIYGDPIDAGSGFIMMPSVVKQTIKPI